YLVLGYSFYCSLLLFFARYGDHRDLHSFPTRRSSDLVAGGGGVPHRHGLGRRRAQAEEGRFRAGVLARRRHRRLAGRRPAAGQGPLSPPAGPRPAATGARAIIPRYRSRPAPPAHHQRFWSPKCPTKPPTALPPPPRRKPPARPSASRRSTSRTFPSSRPAPRPSSTSRASRTCS